MAGEDIQPLVHADLIGDLKLVTAPSATGQVLTTAEAKLHLKVDHSEEDEYIAALVIAAQEFCQDEIPGAKQILRATFDLPVAEFWCGALKLPRPPLISVSSVKYYDDDEVQQTLSTSLYLVDTPWRAPGTVELAEDQDWPTDLSSRRMPVTIRFICGYGLSTDTPAGSVPPVVKQAIRLVIGWMYKNREPSKDEFAAVCRLLAIEGWGSYA